MSENGTASSTMAVFTADGGRTGFEVYVGEHRNRNLGTRGHVGASLLHLRRHEHALERIEVFAKITRVTDADRIAFAPLDRGCNSLPSDGGFDDVVHIADGETIASGFFAVHSEIQVVAARRP